MSTGMLWFNNDAKIDLDRKVDQAARHFRDKYGCKPTLCFVHPSMLNGRLNEGVKGPLTIGEIELRPLNNVRPNHFWVISNGKDPA